MRASTTSTEPPATSNRRKTQGMTNGQNSGMAVRPAPMSKISQSAELDEYTASMRNYLASVENGRRQSISDRTDSASSSSNGNSSGSDREKSPEFQWMDLAALRRAHGAVDVSKVGNSNGVSKSVRMKQVNRPHSPRIGISKDSRHYLHQHRQRENRSTSPGVKSTSKKHISYVGQSQIHCRAAAISSPEKNCTS